MPEERFEERTEPATQRRRDEARERGHVARSMDLNAAIVLLSALLALNFFGRSWIDGILGELQQALENFGSVDVDRDDVGALLMRSASAMGLAMLPFLAMVVIGGLAGNFLQIGFLFTGHPLIPTLEKMDPIAGLQRIFSRRSAVRLVVDVLKTAAIGVVVFWTIWGERHALAALMERELGSIVRYLVEMMFLVSMRAILVLLLLAFLDYAYQRFQYEQDIRMSRQEVREELKRYEGDPKIRERRRAIQRQIAMQRMMARVPKATVVITNPTELAIALEYDKEKMDAPTVTAKGAGLLAQRIREVATENSVPVIQRPEVARVLYKTVDVGQQIPAELYQAVAEILAYVYRLKNVSSAA